MRPFRVVALLSAVLFLVSCATAPAPTAVAPVVATPAPIVVPDTAPAPTPPAPPSEGFAVSEEKYTTSLKEIRDLADSLNAIISEHKIEDWKAHLDTTYAKKFSDPVYLREVANTSAVLKQYGVKMKTIADYFEWVVVPSRSKVVVDDITFVDEERVEAFTVIKSQKILLYQLKLYGKEWKISFW